MSYPLLEAERAYAHVEVRQGRGATGWNQLDPCFSGPCTAGQRWDGAEGAKLAVRHCLYPGDPDSTL